MHQDKISLTMQDILEKEFKVDTRGYRMQEVDEFLDVIISDYDQFYKIIESLEKEKTELLKEIMSLKQELRNASVDVELAKNSKSDTMEITNLDILRRLSNLEKAVFGKDNN